MFWGPSPTLLPLSTPKIEFGSSKVALAIAFRASEPIGIEAEPRYGEHGLMASELGIHYQDTTSAVYYPPKETSLQVLHESQGEEGSGCEAI